ncbi:MAG TPA: exodeoxyribonuclease V subunit gamma [Polyangiaceae bacterium]|nr:exodeoxyribonuclease V subunit gamma [Polyangiaceae bacterium]
MIRLVYSNLTEELLDELARGIRSQQLRDGVLFPVRIVVPSANVESYVRLGLARSCGIAANLQVELLTRFAAQIVADASGARVADAASLEAMALAALLDDELLARPELAPARAYLHAAGDADDAVDLRRIQLAARLGRLFEEYTYSRADMLAAWRERTTLGEGYADVEPWQRALWLAMLGARPIAPTVPLCDAVTSLRPEALPRAVHVFGFAHVARAFHTLFEQVARAATVVVYALSPCEGFWEDTDASDPELLRLWGRPGRDQARALNLLAGFDHDDRFVDPASRSSTGGLTLLARLKRDLLRREVSGDRAPADESILVIDHASIRREVEAVASEIWRAVESDETLTFDEIAVLVPDADAAKYAVHVSAVFREAFDLPYRMVGVPNPGGSRILEAVELLLGLPLGRFTRHEVLRVAVHPSVVASLDDVDPSEWVMWCDALGVVHGAGRQDHQGTYIARDILNWDQGLRRLALGAFMVGDAGGDRRPCEIGGEAYVPHELQAADVRDAAAFGVLMRSLLEDARFARDAQLTMTGWSDFLKELVRAYVGPSRPAEEEDLARCLRRLHRIREVDLGGRPVGYRLAAEVARRRLGDPPAAHGGEGVVVSTLSALRPLPFRVVFACGLGEGRFPAPESDDPLDLRWAKRRDGDVSARDRDKYSFLETLLGARDRLVLSYVSRDPVTADELAPASVVKDLLHVLDRSYLRDGAAPLRRRHPLRRWDPAYYPDLLPGPNRHGSLGTMRLPEARAEARTLALRQSLDKSGDRLDAAHVRARAETDPRWASLAEHLGLVRLPETPVALGARVVVPMWALLKFLEFPLQGWARFRLGLDEQDEDDVMAREDEPFETDYRDETMLLRGVLLGAVDGRTLEHAYDAEVRDRELRGTGPSGVFAAAERGAHLAALETWRAELQAQAIGPGDLVVHRFGRAGEQARADFVHDALVLDVALVDRGGVTRLHKVEVGGRTLPMGPASRTSVTLLKRREKKDDPWARAGRERATLRAFLDQAMLAATGVVEGQEHGSLSVVATPDGPLTEPVTFAPLSRDEAVVWLRTIVRELLGAAHAYFLPCEAVLVRAAREPDGPLAPLLEEARELLERSDGPLALRSAYGPVPRVYTYAPPDEASARAMVERRFAAFFAKREAWPW